MVEKATNVVNDAVETVIDDPDIIRIVGYATNSLSAIAIANNVANAVYYNYHADAEKAPEDEPIHFL